MKRITPIIVVIFGILAFAAASTTYTGSLEAEHSPELSPRSYLPLISNETDLFDMADYIVGDGRLYEVWQWIASENKSTQARHQTQFDGPRFYHTKGIPTAEWEELWMDDEFVYRGTDTSPGGERYYTLREGGRYGSRWSPRHWRVGDVYERSPQVTFYGKSNCDAIFDFAQRSWLKFVAYYPEYTFDTGHPDPITVRGVIELAWLLIEDGQPEERYFYARDFGLVGWANNNGDFSRISEIHQSDSGLPNNTREVISCLNTGDRPIPDQPIFPPRPYEPPYRAK